MNITKQLLEKTYYQILNERKWLNEIDYQKEWLINPESYTHKNNVLAKCPAAGKSNTIAIYLEIRFRLGLLNNPALLFSAAETLLKLNMNDTFKSFKPSFKYITVNTPDDITIGKNKNVNVYISLPQMFTEKNKSNSVLLPKIDLLITDEAHIWFLKKTIQNFIKEQKIKQFVELTGSPYLFNLANQIAKEKKKEEPYRMYYVTTNDLLDRNRITNIKIELITTPAYNFTNKSFVGNYGNLKAGQTSSKKRNRHLLESVLEGMLSKCNYNTDNTILKNKTNLGSISKLWHKIGNMFSDMGQTILTCDSIEMADEFYRILENNQETKDMILKSHSKNDPKSENFFKFEQNPKKYKLLIVVDRGQLGYNYLELFNIVDFTFSTNIVMIHQRLNRVTRKSKLNPDKQKTFFKVSTNELEGYYKVIMSAVMHLNEKHWYQNYNTKNLGQLPLTLIRKRKGKKSTSGKSTNKKVKKVKFQNFDDLELLDIDLFKGVLHNADGPFETYATTTIDEVRRQFFGIENKWNEHNVREEAKNWNRKSDFCKNSQGAVQAAKRLGIYEEICSHMDENNIGKKTNLSNKEAMIEFERLKKTYTSKKDVREKEQTMFNVLGRIFPIDFKNWYNSLNTSKIYNILETDVRKLAKKYPTRKLMEQNGYGAYVRHAIKNGYADEIFQHGTKIWTKELVIKELKKYKHKEDIRKNNPNLRNLAKRYNLWDSIPNKTDVIGRDKKRGIVLQKTLDGKIIKKWSLKDACQFYGCGVVNALYRNKNNISNGYIWQYEK